MMLCGRLSSDRALWTIWKLFASIAAGRLVQLGAAYVYNNTQHLPFVAAIEPVP